MMRVAGVLEGMLVCPEGAAALEAALQLRRQGWLDQHDEVVVFNTGTGLKYAESLQGEPPVRLARGEPLPRVAPFADAEFEFERPVAIGQRDVRLAGDEE